MRPGQRAGNVAALTVTPWPLSITLMRLITFFAIILATSSLHAIPPSKRMGGPMLSTVTRLVGQWHTTSLTGGVATLEVDSVNVQLKHNRGFSATASLTIGGPETFNGTFDARRQTLTLHPEGISPVTCTVSFPGPRRMTVTAPADGITAHFERGAAPTSSAGWF